MGTAAALGASRNTERLQKEGWRAEREQEERGLEERWREKRWREDRRAMDEEDATTPPHLSVFFHHGLRFQLSFKKDFHHGHVLGDH